MNKHLEKAFNLLDESQLDCMIVTDLRNVRYLSGFSGSAGLLLLSRGKTLLYTDFRYAEQAERQAEGFTMRVHAGDVDVFEAVGAEISGCRTIGFEEKHITVENFERMKRKITGKNWCALNLDDLRMVKDNGEISLIETAVNIADKAFARLLPKLCAGMTEIEAVAWLEFYMRQLGADGTSFNTIVASGARSSLPHGQPTEKKLAAGDFITFDFGAVYQGYCSDITRTVILGKADSRQRLIYDTVLSAQLAAISVLKPGVACKAVDEKARAIIKEAGYGECFGHGTGHSLGLAIHENPRLSQTCDVILRAGMVVTVEPGIYIPSWGGVRIEDVAVITDDGARILTATGKELLELAA
ncbi:MAG: aminopeptidase P family protein [Acidaminococcales bacterium]|jgi:Xaa-Pro aminopeptidase|nr:aminopeptidase P family protein [Acidaminococcales bacterium]